MKENKFAFQPKKETAMIRAAIFDLNLSQLEISRAIKKSPTLVSLVLREQRKSEPTLTDIKSYLATQILKQKKKSFNGKN